MSVTTYKEYKPVEFGHNKVTLKNGRVKVTPNIERITVTDYENIVIIDGKLFTEVKNKGGKDFVRDKMSRV